MIVLAAILALASQQPDDLELQVFRKFAEIALLDATVKRVDGQIDVAGRGDASGLKFYLETVAARDWPPVRLQSLQLESPTFTMRFAPSADVGTERLADSIAILESLSDYERMRLTAIRVDDQLRLDGAVLGSAARKDLIDRLAKNGLHVARLTMPATGACRPFAMALSRAPVKTEIVHEALPSPHCGSPPPRIPTRATVIGKNGPLTMRLRGIDLPDVFRVLHDLTGEGFIVDGDVTGRVDLDVEQAPLEDVFAAMVIHGVRVGPGPLRRVSRMSTQTTPQTQTYQGETVSMQFRDAELAAVLCLFGKISGLTVLLAPKTNRHGVTIFAAELPWDRLLEGAIWSAGLTYTIDGTSVIVGPREGAADACAVTADTPSRLANARVDLQELALADIELVGVVRADGKWIGYVQGPPGRLWRVEEGQQLFDGRVSLRTLLPPAPPAPPQAAPRERDTASTKRN